MTKDKALVLVQEEWYQALVEDCHAIIVETIFNSNIELIKGKWLLGERICQENDNFKRQEVYGKGIVENIARDLGKSQSGIYFCIQFYNKYPAKTFSNALENLPEGKNISWHKIVNNYLSDGKGKDGQKPNKNFMTVRIDEIEKIIWLKERFRDFQIQYVKEVDDE